MSTSQIVVPAPAPRAPGAAGRSPRRPLPATARGQALLRSLDALLSLLIKTGVLAARHGLDDRALVIRRLLVRLRVDATRFDVACALALLYRGDAAGCAELIEREVLSRDPHHEVAAAVQVCAWRAQGRPGWRVRAQSLLVSSVDPGVRLLLRQCADETPHPYS